MSKKFFGQGEGEQNGVVESYGRLSDLDSLPKKGIANGSTFFDIENGEVYMFLEAETNPDENDGQWVRL